MHKKPGQPTYGAWRQTSTSKIVLTEECTYLYLHEKRSSTSKESNPGPAVCSATVPWTKPRSCLAKHLGFFAPVNSTLIKPISGCIGCINPLYANWTPDEGRGLYQYCVFPFFFCCPPRSQKKKNRDKNEKNINAALQLFINKQTNKHNYNWQ